MIHRCHYQIIASIWALSYSRILNGIDILKKQLLVYQFYFGTLTEEHQSCLNICKRSCIQSPDKTQIRIRICGLVTMAVDNIERVQRRSARYVLNDYRSDSSVTAMINHLNWESLEDRRNKASLHTFYKMFNNLTTIPYIQYVQLSTVTSTRYSHPFKLIPMLAKKNPLKYSFLSRTIPLWNQLPQDLVNSNSLISFKNKLDDYMIEL